MKQDTPALVRYRKIQAFQITKKVLAVAGISALVAAAKYGSAYQDYLDHLPVQEKIRRTGDAYTPLQASNEIAKYARDAVAENAIDLLAATQKTMAPVVQETRKLFGMTIKTIAPDRKLIDTPVKKVEGHRTLLPETNRL